MVEDELRNEHYVCIAARKDRKDATSITYHSTEAEALSAAKNVAHNNPHRECFVGKLTHNIWYDPSPMNVVKLI